MIIDDSLNGSAEKYKSNLSFENQITAYSGNPPSSPLLVLIHFSLLFCYFCKGNTLNRRFCISHTEDY